MLRRTVIPLVVALFIAVGSAWATSTNLLVNPGFEQVGSAGISTSVTGAGNGGASAAAGWFAFNNASATTTTMLVPSTLAGGGSEMLAVTTTGASNGVAQNFLAAGTGPAHTMDSIWVFINSGCVGMGVGNGGNIIEDTSACLTNEWINLSAPNGVSPANEFIVFAANASASFFVDNASVTAATSTVPESSTLFLMAIGFLAIASLARRSIRGVA